MALAPLATTADLDARGIVSNFDQAEKFLEIASAVVRNAAGTPISEVTSTVTLDGYHNEPWLRLPGSPVTAVESVTVDGVEVDDWRHAGERVWRWQGWASGGWPGRPSTVSVTYTHGLSTVPEEIVDLVCAMVAAAKSALDTDDEGLGLAVDNGRVQSVTIDSFTETYSTSGDAVEAITQMTLPARTRAWLANQFGNGVSTVTSR